MANDRVEESAWVISPAGISTRILKHHTPWSAYKTRSFLSYPLAGIEKKEKKLDDIILTDHDDNISELFCSNIFWKILPD